jgi:HAD superfamily hydrolase (TIGR01509 family)
MHLKAFIFDMDGVMLDSEPIHLEAYNKVLVPFGVSITMPVFKEKYMGKRGMQVSEKIVEAYSLPLTAENLHQMKRAEHENFLKNRELPVTPGLKEAIQEMKKLVTLALASNSNPTSISIIVERLGVKEYFSLLLSGSNVPSGKPAPDIYLKTAEELGVKPNECAVLEDSPVGVTAAKAAGMACIAITTTHSREELAEADVIIDRMDELVGVLQKL